MNLISLFFKQPSWQWFVYLFFTDKTDIQLLVLRCLSKLYSAGAIYAIDYNSDYKRVDIYQGTNGTRCAFVVGYGKRKDDRLSLLLNPNNILRFKMLEHRNYSATSDVSQITAEIIK